MTKTEQYEKNKAVKCGEVIVCPICGKEFVKKQYSQAFCCGKCKDKFWNKKGDRHKSGYYEQYNYDHPYRYDYRHNRVDYCGIKKLNEQIAREAYLTDEDFRDYVDECDEQFNSGYDWEEHGCSIDLETHYENCCERHYENCCGG